MRENLRVGVGISVRVLLGRVSCYTIRGACLRKFASPTPAEWDNLRKYAMETTGSGLRKYALRQNHTILGRWDTGGKALRNVSDRVTPEFQIHGSISSKEWKASLLAAGSAPSAARARCTSTSPLLASHSSSLILRRISSAKVCRCAIWENWGDRAGNARGKFNLREVAG